jgi:hypothetical protein
MMRVLTWLAVGLAGLYILFTATPLADVYSAPLFVQPNLKKSDAIALMSRGAIDLDWVTPDAAQRTWGALKLYWQRYAPVIISAGGDPQSADSGEAVARSRRSTGGHPCGNFADDSFVRHGFVGDHGATGLEIVGGGDLSDGCSARAWSVS